MNPKVYKYFGLGMKLISIVILIMSLLDIILFTKYAGFASALFDPLILLGLILFCALFFPGRYYYKFEKQNKKDDGLIKASLILIIICMLILALSFFVIAPQAGDPIGAGLTFLAIATMIALPIYIVGIVALIIHVVKQRKNVKSSKKRK